MWTRLPLLFMLLAAQAGGPGEAAPASTPRPTAPPPPGSRLDESGFWKAWLLYEAPHENEGGRRRGQIQPKSIFIAPSWDSKGQQKLPDCAPGYQADGQGRCNRIVKIDHSAQLGFLLQKLNSKFAKPPTPAPLATSTDGPLHIAIPLAEPPRVPTTTPAPPTTVTTTTSEGEGSTELAELVVVAAQVELQDGTSSTALPAALFTLWRINETTTVPPEVSETQPPPTTLVDFTETPAMETTLTTTEEPQETTTWPPEEPEAVKVAEQEDELIITTTEVEAGTTLEVTEVPQEVSQAPQEVSQTPQETSRPPQRVSTPQASTNPPLIIQVFPESPKVASFVPQEVTPPPQRVTPTSPVRLQQPDSIVFDLSGESDGSQSSPQWESKSERITFPSGERSTTPWSWGSWEATPQPLLLSFYSHVPSVGSGGTRTRLSRPSSVLSGSGRPLFYQELSGPQVAEVLGPRWRHRQRI